MLRLFATASLLALSGTALAQKSLPSVEAAIQETAPQEMPSAETPPAEAPPTETPPAETPATEAAPSAPPAAASREDTVKQVVEAEFSVYDADKNGELNKEEFTNWVTKLRQNSLASQGRPPVPDTEMQEWAKNAFAKSDADKSKTVSKAELETFLMG